MGLLEILLMLSIGFTVVCAVCAVSIFAYDFFGALAGGGGGYKWSKVPLFLGLGTILFFVLSVVFLIVG